jgi:hypothetical protein
VDVRAEAVSPAYITGATTFDWSVIIHPKDSAPGSDLRGPLGKMRELLEVGHVTSLDQSQLKAIELALRSRVALIQVCRYP